MRSKTVLMRESVPDFLPLSSLRTHKDNPRIDERIDITDLVASIREFGIREPLVVTEKGSVAIGNRRFRALVTISKMEAIDHGAAPIGAVPVLILPANVTTQEVLSLLADHSERPLTLPEIGREIGLLIRSGLTPTAAARAVADQAAPIFSRGRDADPAKGAIGRYQTLLGLATDEVQAHIRAGGEIPSASALRKIGALNNARRTLATGGVLRGKNAPKNAEDATSQIVATMTATPPEKAEKDSRPSTAAIEEAVIAHGQGSDIGQALLWTLGRAPLPTAPDAEADDEADEGTDEEVTA